jgi:hypothetical protein
MPMPKKITKRFDVRFANADQLARQILSGTSTIAPTIERGATQLGRKAVPIYRSHAPGGPGGKVGRAVEYHQDAGIGTIIADPVNPLDGYHFIGVTRFGHRSNIIKPRHDRISASIISNKKRRSRPKSPRKGTRPALAFKFGGELIFRAYSHGYHPIVDWTESAREEVNKLARDEMQSVRGAFFRRIHA